MHLEKVSVRRPSLDEPRTHPQGERDKAEIERRRVPERLLKSGAIEPVGFTDWCFAELVRATELELLARCAFGLSVGFLRQLISLGGVLHGLTGMLVASHMIFLAVMCRGCKVRVSC